MASDTPGIVLDVDGTLVDSNYLHVYAFIRAFRDAGHQVTAADIHRRVGMGADVLVTDLLGELDEQVVEGHTKHYEQFYDELTAFPGAADAVRELARRGAAVVLASSASGVELDALRKALDVDAVLSGYTSSSDAGEAKPAPDILEVAMAKAGLHPSSTVMVGDTVWDVEAAARAGIPCIGVLSGGIARAVLSEAGAVEVYDDVAQLLERVDESLIGHLLRTGRLS